MNGSDIIRFEEQNWDTLHDKFIKEADIRDKWEAFVEAEYERRMPFDREPDEDILRGDR